MHFCCHSYDHGSMVALSVCDFSNLYCAVAKASPLIAKPQATCGCL